MMGLPNPDHVIDLTRNLVVGDRVRTWGREPIEGKVTRVQVRSVWVVWNDGQEIVVPRRDHMIRRVR